MGAMTLSKTTLGKTALRIKIFSVTTFSIATLSITTFGIAILSITTSGIATLSITTFGIATLSISDNQHNDIHHSSIHQVTLLLSAFVS